MINNLTAKKAFLNFNFNKLAKTMTKIRKFATSNLSFYSIFGFIVASFVPYLVNHAMHSYSQNIEILVLGYCGLAFSAITVIQWMFKAFTPERKPEQIDRRATLSEIIGAIKAIGITVIMEGLMIRTHDHTSFACLAILMLINGISGSQYLSKRMKTEAKQAKASTKKTSLKKVA